MVRSEISLKRELHRIEKLLKNKKNTVWTDGQISGAQQALAWALGMNAMIPHKAFNYK